jgi:hypothetical protein
MVLFAEGVFMAVAFWSVFILLERYLSWRVLFVTVVFWNSMIIFLAGRENHRRREKHRRLDFSCLSTFALVCIYTLVVETGYLVRAYVLVLAISTAAIRILVTKARKDGRSAYTDGDGSLARGEHVPPPHGS